MQDQSVHPPRPAARHASSVQVLDGGRVEPHQHVDLLADGEGRRCVGGRARGGQARGCIRRTTHRQSRKLYGPVQRDIIRFCVQHGSLLELQLERGHLLLRRQGQKRPHVAAHPVAHLARREGRGDVPASIARDTLIKDAPVHLGTRRKVHLSRGTAGNRLTLEHLGQVVHEAVGREDEEGTARGRLGLRAPVIRLDAILDETAVVDGVDERGGHEVLTGLLNLVKHKHGAGGARRVRLALGLRL
eukprot:scaffold14107_cov124-Isochrysis_galbana.AAC.5